MIDDVARAIFQPTADELRARIGSDTEVIARPDLLLAIGSLPQHPWSSTVYWARWTEAEADARIADVLEIFRARGQSFVWLVTMRSTPASLGDRLVRHGFIRELVGRVLMAELPIAGLRVNPDVRVQMVVDRAGPAMAYASTTRTGTTHASHLSSKTVGGASARTSGSRWRIWETARSGRPVGRSTELSGSSTLAVLRL